ncbi:MAG: NAD(P)-dependent oxidoreductase [Ignavibacteriae bacterium]|nr:NAD(P)-dependent oxidoreductase [Ignavibacteriota bacterium]
MKIFLTGGTGFIGSHFINGAHRAGHEIICLKIKNTGSSIILEKDPDWIIGKLDDDFPADIFNGIDVLVHLAAHSANVPYDTLNNCLYWNLTAPLKLFNTAQKAGVKNYLAAGSCFEYGKSGEKYEFIPPDAPLLPTMTYPTSKAAASVAFSGWTAINNLKLKYLRIFQVYGEGELETRFWPFLKKTAEEGNDFPMTEGEQIRDFMHVSEVAERFIKELDFSYITDGKPFIDNVGSGNPKSLREFAEYWWEKWNAKGKLKFGEIPYRENEIMRFIPQIND